MFRSIVYAALATLTLAPAGALAAEPPPQGPPVPAAQRKAIAVPAEVLARYVGRYGAAGQFEVAITLDDGRLFGALSGRPRHELFADSPTFFFATDVDAQAEFEHGSDGRATGVRLTINGQVMEAPRIPSAEAAASP